MNVQNRNSDESNAAAGDGDEYSEAHLRGQIGGAEQKAAVEHTEYEQSRAPESELRLDGEDASLYNDGLDIGDDSEPLAGTDGDNLTGAKG
jgi:hypothetical protein